jgi:hypothetical protein
MRHPRFTLRPTVVALCALALLAPTFPPHITAMAAAAQVSAANAANGDQDEEGGERRGQRRTDPCRQAHERAAGGRPLPPE